MPNLCSSNGKKKLVHSFYHIPHQPKGVPYPRNNFSGTGGTSKCAANYIISFEVYNGCIGQQILKLWRQESWPFILAELPIYREYARGSSVFCGMEGEKIRILLILTVNSENLKISKENYNGINSSKKQTKIAFVRNENTLKKLETGAWVKGGGAGGTITPPLFGRIEGGAALLIVLLLAPPPVLGSHLRPWEILHKKTQEQNIK